MNTLLSPWTLAAACGLIVLGLLGSPNAALWAASLLALPVAAWLLGGKQAYRVLLWLIAVNWLQVIGDVVAADLTGSVLSKGALGPYRVQAIVWSLCAIVVLALGMRFGTRLGGWLFRPTAQPGVGSSVESERSVGLNRIMLAYFASLIVTLVSGSVAASVPALTQAVLALSLLKFVCVYLITARVFESGREYGWLALVSLVEMVTGLVGFFASYKEAFIVMLIALASSRRPATVRMWIFSTAAVISVVWVSMVWTAAKQEYRHLVFGNPIEQRLEWMAQRFFVDSTDYRGAVVTLFQRIGYTEFYAHIIAREDIGSLPHTFHLYASAAQHILTPRILFPDKPALNDSKQTNALLGLKITGDKSIGVGYIAQAHVDFGFPGLLLPILSIGLLLGGAAEYFMTRSAPLLIREAFATAALFVSFSLEKNIDKALGGFITGCLVMALGLKFAYPMIARWLAGSPAGRRPVADGAFGRMPT